MDKSPRHSKQPANHVIKHSVLLGGLTPDKCISSLLTSISNGYFQDSHPHSVQLLTLLLLRRRRSSSGGKYALSSAMCVSHSLRGSYRWDTLCETPPSQRGSERGWDGPTNVRVRPAEYLECDWLSELWKISRDWPDWSVCQLSE